MLNQRASEAAGVVGIIDPDAYAPGNFDTGWIDASRFHRFLAAILVGDIAATGTVDALIRIASNGSGAGAEAATGKAITQMTQVGNDSNKQALIDVKPEDLKGATLSFKDGSATHFSLRVTLGTAGADMGAAVLGLGPRYAPASGHDLSSVDEIVA